MSVSTLAPSRATPVAALKSWTPWQAANSSLVGHAEVIFAGGWIVSGIPVFRRSGGSLSVGQPNAAQLDRDGRVKTDASGKRVYAQVISFATAAAKGPLARRRQHRASRRRNRPQRHHPGHAAMSAPLQGRPGNAGAAEKQQEKQNRGEAALNRRARRAAAADTAQEMTGAEIERLAESAEAMGCARYGTRFASFTVAEIKGRQS